MKIKLLVIYFATAGLALAQPSSAAEPTPPLPTANIRGIPTPPLPVAAIPAPPMLPTNTLAWDADMKDFDAKPGEQMARFTFYVTNISTEVVVITNLQRSCGCTDASMPAQPWTLTPGDHGPVQAFIDLRGKAGKISKSLTVQTLIGWK